VQRLREIFDTAVTMPAEERPEFVAHACGDDPELQKAVMELLQADGLGPMDRAIYMEARAMARSMSAGYASRMFGPYRATKCIGTGGMGAVFQAVREDDEYHKTVAVKILPSGLETGVGIERFRRERQILANLDHPNIARLLDGGTTAEGLPYLVMEFVDGLPLDRYVEQGNLTVEQRLRLFLRICDAAAYAHRSLVVHCDLKPSNILVTAEGIPKLLDFGIAKLLNEARGSSTATSPLMTPEYASPEQVRGERITTSSDVYSLGVIMYLLLTGRGPYRGQSGSASETIRLVCEQELDVRALARDLQGIVSKATRKEAPRRYRSADELAVDVTCYMENRPVSARRGTFLYRAGKYIRRNAIGIALSLLCVAALAFGVTTRIIESRKAEARFNQLRGLARFLVFDTFDELSRVPKSADLRRKIIVQSLQYLDALEREAPKDPELMTDVGESYIRLGTAQGYPEFPNMGDTSGAFASALKAKSVFESLVRIRRTAHSRGDLCLALEVLGPLYCRIGDPQGAVAIGEQFVQIALELGAAKPNSAGHRIRESNARHILGTALLRRGESTKSVADIRHALDLFQQSAQGLPIAKQLPDLYKQFTETLQLLSTVHASYAHCRVAEWTGDRTHYDEALKLERNGISIAREVIQKDGSPPEHYLAFVALLSVMGSTLSHLGQASEAEVSFREALTRAEELAATDPADVEAEKEIADVCLSYAEALIQAGRKKNALPLLSRAITIYQKIATRDPMNGDVRKGLEAAQALH